MLTHVQLPIFHCCHISASFPSAEILKRSNPVTVIGLSLADTPRKSLLGMPVSVNLINTLSPFDIVS